MTWVVHDASWKEHVEKAQAYIGLLEEADLVVNLEKCEFVQVKVLYLGYVVGHGQVSPLIDDQQL